MGLNLSSSPGENNENLALETAHTICKVMLHY